MKQLELFRNSIITLFLVLIACLEAFSQTNEDKVLTPSIVYDQAELKGEIKGMDFDKEEAPVLKIILTDPVTYFREYIVPIQEDGTFQFQTYSFSLSHAAISSSFFNSTILLFPGETTRLVIDINEPQNNLYSDGKSSLGYKDIAQMSTVLSNALHYLQENNDFGLVETGNDYLRVSDEYIRICDEFIDKDNSISAEAKVILKYGVRPFLFSLRHLNYYDLSTADFRQPIFFFLKSFHVQDAVYYYSSYIHEFFRFLINNDSLSLPLIEHSSIKDWLQEAKTKLGYAFEDNGYFYEVLVTNAFINQLRGAKLLSKEQISDVQTYFANTPYHQILLEENKRVEELIAENQRNDFSKIIPT